MSFRSFFGGLFVMIGCAAAMLASTGMIVSMQMQAGTGLLVGLAILAAATVLLLLGTVVLMFRR